MARYILAVDQGTTNTKVLLVDARGAVVARASRPVSIAFPQPGWVEQDGDHLWQTVTAAIDDCLDSAIATGAIAATTDDVSTPPTPGTASTSDRAGAPAGASTIGPDVIAAIAISNQRESVLAWERATGRPAGPCVIWQCRRTAPFCETLRARGLDDRLRRATGLPIDPLFSASKMRWLLESIPDGHRRAAQGDICLGTVDSWLLWNFTGGATGHANSGRGGSDHAGKLARGTASGGIHACDRSNASRTQLYNLHTGTWDSSLLDLFDIPAAALPRIVPSSGIAGHSVAHGRLGAGIPIASLIGDSHAALFGHAAFTPGTVKATYGTGSSLMTLIDEPVTTRAGLSTTVAWAIGDRTTFALEGNITVTGGAVDWLAHLLGLSGGARDVAALAATVPDSGGVIVVPAFAGLGAPHWDPQARAAIHGLTLGTTPAHLARATLDSIAFQVRDVFDALHSEIAAPLPALCADGGASANDRLMQFQADVLGCPVQRTHSTDLSACGAAWLAGLAVGMWTSLDELRTLAPACDRFEPHLDTDARARRIEGWRDAVSRVRSVPAASPLAPSLAIPLAAGAVSAPQPVASSAHGENR